ncbi:hypothetical protein J7J90_03440 [Candidatus Micrarchaeota archaeon]|nr:hypothetical protein [Candidatus Micrarchaeota archaeon]
MRKALLFLFVLGTVLFAQVDTGVEFNQTGNVSTMLGINTPPGSSSYGWALYAILSLFFVLMLAAIVYMLGKSFNIPQAEAWAKVELLNIFGSFLLLIMILVILNAIYSVFMGSMLQGSAYCLKEGYDGNHTMDFAMCKVQAQITTLDNLWAQANEANKPQEVEASTCYSLWGLTLWCGDWYGDLRQRIESAHYVGTKVLGLLIPLHAEFVLMRYIAQNMLAVFLPLGIVLRCFPPTRGPAGLLIAMSIGLYFVFPALNFVLDPSTTQPQIDQPITNQKTDYACFQGFKNTITQIQYETDVEQSQIMTYSYEQAADIIADITITGLFYPMVAFAGAVMFIYVTAPFFGGEVMDFYRVVSKMV